MPSTNARRALLVVVLLTAAGSWGSAHQPSLTVAPRLTNPPERLVRHGGLLADRMLRRPAGTAQSSTGAVGRRIVNSGLERWVAKANGVGHRWDPLDGRPAAKGVDDEDGGFVDSDLTGPTGTQSELSVAVDSTGQHVVIAMNDFRGFQSNPVSLSGFAYSDDGGATFTDGGQLPVTVPTTTTAFGKLPQVFGDPEVKYVGGSTFVYFSIIVAKYGPNPDGEVQTLGVHRSTDYGHTWTGPYEVTAATNPNGQINTSGFPEDAADKEFADVDPDTGRVMLSWSNFTPFATGGVEISMTYSDDLTTAATPTWAPRRVIASSTTDGQASIPRFAGNGSANAYVAWRRFTSYYTDRIAFSRSTDNGVTWSAPVELTGNFVTMDQVLGNDRVNTSPSLAVDTSPGPYRGNVYVVHSSNNTLDGADISFRRSTDGGLTFSAAVTLNSRPGGDRPQWFPWVTVDRSTGRVYISYYDQGAASSGDLTDTTYLYSDDGGTTWHKPVPLTDRPFHAGYGNDTSQPNLGDYNQAVAQGGELFIVWAANPPVVPFTDGQPSPQMTVPDVVFKRAPAVPAAVRLGAVAATDSGGNGFVDPGEDVQLTLPLVNYAQNPLFAAAISNLAGTLTSATPGVTVTQANSAYPNAAVGAAVSNSTAFELRVGAGFVSGTPIELELNVTSSEGTAVLLHTLATGTPKATTLLSEDFEAAAPGALPTGWIAAHGGGSNTVPWTTSATFNPGSKGAYHPNAIDAADPTRWERLFSPAFAVPAQSDYVVVEFDAKYDTEDDPNLQRTGYDGFFLRITDLTTGRTLRSVLAEAFATEITTGTLHHYPKHLPRGSHPDYFEDMSVWAGDSAGVTHVRMTLPGMAGSTAQLRFEYTQDGSATCADVRPGHTCGVLIDNVVVRSVVAASADLSITKSGPATVLSGHNLTYLLVATNHGTDPARNDASLVTVTDPLPAGTTYVSSSAPAGWTCQTPAVGSGGTITCSAPTLAAAATASISIVVNVACGLADGTQLNNTATIAAGAPADPDATNNTSSATTDVSNPPPVISGLSPTPSVLWPPNGRLINVTLDYAVTDNCGTVTSALQVSSNEPSGQEPDWVIVNPHHVRLRAERSSKGTGRIYTIVVTATNSQGGVTSATTTVVVPHDRGHGEADEGGSGNEQ